MNNQLPDYLFASDDGALYDTRRQDWHKAPLRPVYRRHFSTIETTAQFKASIRAGGHTFPGGYTLAFVTTDGGALCFDCARKEARLILDSIRHDIRDGWRVDGMINADECDGGATCDHCDGIWCDHCGATVSAPFDSEEN